MVWIGITTRVYIMKNAMVVGVPAWGKNEEWSNCIKNLINYLIIAYFMPPSECICTLESKWSWKVCVCGGGGGWSKCTTITECLNHINSNVYSIALKMHHCCVYFDDSKKRLIWKNGSFHLLINVWIKSVYILYLSFRAIYVNFLICNKIWCRPTGTE